MVRICKHIATSLLTSHASGTLPTPTDSIVLRSEIFAHQIFWYNGAAQLLIDVGGKNIISQKDFDDFWDWFGKGMQKIRYQRHICSLWLTG